MEGYAIRSNYAIFIFLLPLKQGPDGLPMPGCWQKVGWAEFFFPGAVRPWHTENPVTVILNNTLEPLRHLHVCSNAK